MVKIGLCGSSGAGKGYVCKIFAKHGFECIDTDKIYKDITYPGSDCVKELCGFFGNEILTCDGHLDRAGLALRVFEDKESESNLKMLNKISHKHIRKKTEEILSSLEKDGKTGAVIDAPVLFESGFDSLCDYTAFVSAPEEMKIKRIMERDKITRQKAVARLKNQLPDAKLRELCDFEIDNTDGADIDKQIICLLKGISIEK